jgi:hypothetical protein
MPRKQKDLSINQVPSIFDGIRRQTLLATGVLLLQTTTTLKLFLPPQFIPTTMSVQEKPLTTIATDFPSSPLEPPTTLSILMYPTLSAIPPKSPVGAFLWRRRMWFEATFVFILLEPWEKILLSTCLLSPSSTSF